MSTTRSLIAAGGLTALVILTVLAVGAQRGAFGLRSDPEAIAVPAQMGTSTRDMLTAAPDAGSVQLTYADDDEDGDEHDEMDHDERRSDSRRGRSGRDD